MEQQLPVALQVAMYAASLGIVVLVVALAAALFGFRTQLERGVGAVEQLNDEMKPLAQETRVVMTRLGDLSGRAQEQWTRVEGIVDTARHWSDRANHLAEEVSAAVGPPVAAASRGIRLLRRGLGIFAGAADSKSIQSTPTEREEAMSDVNQGLQGGQSRGTGILVAALVGAAVGAGVALLLAPCSGRETRGWLANKGREMKDKTASALEYGKEATRRAAKELGKDAEEPSPLDRPTYAEAGTTNMHA